MRWDKSNAEAMMALACAYHSGLWDAYWESERETIWDRQDLSSHTKDASGLGLSNVVGA